MRRVLCSLLLAAPLAAQTINPNQIRPATSNNQVLTTVTAGVAPSWQSAGGPDHSWPVLSWNGTQTSNSQVFASIITPPAVLTVPGSCSGSTGSLYPPTFGGSLTPATGSTAITLYDATASASVCIFTFAASATTATVTAGAESSIPASHVLYIYGPATPDATFGNFQITFATTTPGGSGGGGGFTAGGDLSGTGTSQQVIGILGSALPTLATGYPYYNGSAWVFNSGTAPGVTSVGLTMPADFSVAGSPVTGSGGFTVTRTTQSANLVQAGPASGAAAAPSYRALVPLDLPVGTNAALGALKCDGITTNCPAGVIVASGTGIPYPSGTGIANVTSGTSWGTTYNAGNLVPTTFLPKGSSSAFGTMQCDNTTITCPGGVLTAVTGPVSNVTLNVSGGTQGANSCSGTTNITMTGLTTSMLVSAGYTSNPSSLVGWGSTGGMSLKIWPSASNTATWALCNPNTFSITYSAISLTIGAR